MLDAGTTDADEVIEELGHEPNGYFWDSIAQLLVDAEAPYLAGRFRLRPGGRHVRRPRIRPASAR
ncbi:hypothetical protein [Dactylosporangium salmoneum]|uniref:hypothetical protein n=1 Tax=Dactylosporangium salmoneum TaxID=53361 RepID=UPI003CD0651C